MSQAKTPQEDSTTQPLEPGNEPVEETFNKELENQQEDENRDLEELTEEEYRRRGYPLKNGFKYTSAGAGAAGLFFASPPAAAAGLGGAALLDYIGEDYNITNRAADELKDFINETREEFREGYREGRYGED